MSDDDKAEVVIMVPLTRKEVEILDEALDSHIYWQLSDSHYRNNGYVNDPGSDDEENVKKIEEAKALVDKFDTIRAAAGDTTS